MDRIGILIELLGDKQALKSLSQMEAAKKRLTNDKLELRFNVAVARKQIKALEDDIKQLTANRKNTKVGSKEFQELTEKIADARKQINGLKDDIKNFQFKINYDVAGTQMLNNEINQIKANAISLRDVLSGAGTWFSAIGSGLQSIGGIFNTDVLSYITQTLTQLGTNAVMSNLGKAATRYDTLRTYPLYMNAVGISTEKAKESLDEVDQVIQGLPIGLNEAAIDIRRTTMLMDGDVETATKFVEGFDQALFAGGAPAQMMNYARIEMQRLLASGELAQKRQWMSLINGLGVSTQFLKDAMGYTDMTTKEFEDMVYDPDRGVTGEEVIKGFANLADDEQIQEMIRIYKSTIESGLSNLQYAFQRGIANVYKAADETMQSSMGMSISEYLYQGRDFIDRAFGGIADWIRDNPDTIESIFDQIDGLAQRVEGFDFGKAASSIIGAVQSLVDIATWIYDHIPEPVIRGFLTFSMVWATPLGKAFSTLGNLLTTMAYLPFPQLGRLTRGMGQMGRFVGSFKSVAQGFLGISAYIGVIAEIGAVIWEFTKVAETIAQADLTGLDKNLKPVINFFANGGALATILTGVFTGISMIPGASLAVGAGELLSAGLIAIVGEIGLVIAEYVKVAEQIANAKMPSDIQLKRVGDVFEAFGEIFTTDLFLNVPNGWKIDKLTDAIDIINELAGATDALNAIADANLDTTKISANMQAMVEVMSDLNLILVQDFWSSDAFRTKQNNKIVTNLTDTITQLSEAFGAMNDLNTMLDESGIMDRQRGGGSGYENVVNAIEMLAEDMQTIASAVSVNSDILGTKREEIVDGIRNEIIKDYTEIVGSITDLATEIVNSKDVLSEATKGGTLAIVSGQMSVVLDRIKDMLIDINDKVLLINQAKDEKDWSYIAQKINSYKEIITSVIGIVSELKNSAEDMAWTHGSIFTNGDFRQGVDQNSAFAVIGNLRRFIHTLMLMAPEFESLQGLSVSNVSANSESIKSAIESLVSVAQSINDNAEMFATINNEGGAVYNLKKMFTELTEALSGQDATFSAATFSIMAEAIQTLQTSLDELSGIDLSNLNGDLEAMVKNLEDIKKNAKDASRELNELRNKMVVLSGVAKGTENSYDGFITALQKISTNASSAYWNVDSLINALNAVTDKTVTITVNTPGLDEAILGLRTLNAMSSAGSIVNRVVNAAANAIQRAHGGKVNYLAKGGTPFKPRGTDTVPAMLTPGEWVINRRASRAFGDNFMRKINAMDIPGAMDALMKRSKWTPSGGVYYTTNNYNNQSVTQNFSREKDSKTSYRRANRYLGAL